MKKSIFFIALMLLTALGAQAAKKVYALWEPAKEKLTYAYVDESNISTFVAAGNKAEEYDPSAETRFGDYYADIKTVLVDKTMKDAPLDKTSNMFYGGQKYVSGEWKDHYLLNVTTINGLENLNTSNVTSMYKMFYGMEKITSVDLTTWDFSKVENTYGMFCYCDNLETIYCNADLSGVSSTNNMLYDCKKLVGGNGSKYTSLSGPHAQYALPDGLNGKTGLFTAGKKIYTSFANDTLTYYYDNKWVTRPTVELYTGTAVRFTTYYNDVKVGVIDESVKEYKFTTLEYLFCGYNSGGTFYSLKKMEKVIGLEYLDGENVTNMGAMFYDCDALTEIDLSNLKTPKVQKIMSAFASCAKLKVIDLSSFDPSKLAYTKLAFSACPELETIYCNSDWNAVTAITADNSYNMFQGCSKLKGGKGTAYKDANPKDKTYARPDGGTGDEGYFTKIERELYGAFTDDTKKTLVIYYDDQKGTRAHVSNWPEFSGSSDFREITTAVFDESVTKARPTTTEDWFFDCETLASIEHLEYLNTSKVTSMNNMFRSCKALTAINVNSFDISSLTKTTFMFLYCENLAYLICDKNWNTGAITESDSWGMFNGCEKLKGGNGTAYDSNKDKIDYAHPDVAGDPGYFITEAQYETATGIEEVQKDKVQSTKMMENGVLYIKYNGQMYDVQGKRVN